MIEASIPDWRQPNCGQLFCLCLTLLGLEQRRSCLSACANWFVPTQNSIITNPSLSWPIGGKALRNQMECRIACCCCCLNEMFGRDKGLEFAKRISGGLKTRILRALSSRQLTSFLYCFRSPSLAFALDHTTTDHWVICKAFQINDNLKLVQTK